MQSDSTATAQLLLSAKVSVDAPEALILEQYVVCLQDQQLRILLGLDLLWHTWGQLASQTTVSGSRPSCSQLSL